MTFWMRVGCGAGERLHLQFIQCDVEALIREVVEEMTMVHGDGIVLD